MSLMFLTSCLERKTFVMHDVVFVSTYTFKWLSERRIRWLRYYRSDIHKEWGKNCFEVARERLIDWLSDWPLVRVLVCLCWQVQLETFWRTGADRGRASSILCGFSVPLPSPTLLSPFGYLGGWPTDRISVVYRVYHPRVEHSGSTSSFSNLRCSWLLKLCHRRYDLLEICH